MENQNVHLHILRASGRLEPYRNDLEQTIKGAIAKTAGYISLHPIDMVVCDDPRRVIRGFGHGARTYNPYTIQVSLDPAFPDFLKTVIGNELPRAISHELHHAVRWKAVGYGKTLLEVLVTEGLASRFEQEMWGGTPSSWAAALSEKALAEVQVQAKTEYANTKYDHGRWFFGTGDLPRWAGYTLGYQIVGTYLKKYPDQTAASLVSTPAKAFIVGLRVGKEELAP